MTRYVIVGFLEGCNFDRLSSTKLTYKISGLLVSKHENKDLK